MSYDLFAFDPDTAPTDENLLAWFKNQAEWSEQHSYSDTTVTTPRLRAFYYDLIKTFPPMNGPDAPTEDGDADTDYSIGHNILYVSFRWPKADHACQIFIELAAAHGVGVCEISESPVLVHRPAEGDATGGRTSGSEAYGSAHWIASRIANTPAPASTNRNEQQKIEGKLYL